MKRQTAMALAAVFAMSVAGTALAAPANPFVDVPAKHWSYDAVSKLAQSGVVSGYGDGTYKGDKTMTRYEMATIIAKAMANSEKVDAETQKTIDALAAEYGAELNNLGVRVDNLEKKIDNVTITGVIRARYDNNETAKIGDMQQALRTRLIVKGKINDEWTYTGRLQNVQNLRTTGGEDPTSLNWAFVQGKVGVFDVTAGRYDVKPAYGVALDDTVDGINVGFGNKLKANLFAGKDHYSEIAPNAANDRNNTYIASLAYSFSKKLNAKAAYFGVDYNKTLNEDNAKLYEVGMDYQLTPSLNIQGVYLKSNADDDDKGYAAKLSYKGASAKNKGSFGMWAAYRNQDASTMLSSTYDYDQVISAAGAGVGAKGYEIGVTYAPMKNALWTTSYADLEATATGVDRDGTYFRSQLEFFF
ncbi:S-layer homology domain-containing protein [Sporomusa sp. GT1]|uniref:S-layer homology domain-containing protein n=1 Tax=Sporomusa sp. GT1 TaxID=1534747 RepID=UPI0016654CDB|nr:S-layer homology domain-containing protein [Sporomusa sp. GT1]